MGMQIELQNISKKYSNNYIIKDFSYQFQAGNSYAILGSNGSGKSTLVKILTGLYSVSKGEVKFSMAEKTIPVDKVFNHVSLAAPWGDVIEDLSLKECIEFHFKFRQSINGVKVNDLLKISGLEESKNKFIHQFSSGMKQRVRLLLGVLTQSDLLLLDEPTSNLDASGKQWYADLVKSYSGNRTIIVASNHLQEEYSFCKEVIELK
jgi:ABC-type multidrug transport system ATPase subunit